MKRLYYRKTIKEVIKTLFKVMPELLLFEMIYKMLAMLVFTPLFSLIIKIMLRLGNYKIAINENIIQFLERPSGFIGGFILAIIAIVFIYFEFAVIILMVYYNYRGIKMRIVNAMKMAIPSLSSLLNIGIAGFFFYSLIILPIANLGITSSVIPSLEVPDFINQELTKTMFGQVSFVIIIALIIFAYYQLTFVLPIMVMERVSFFEAIGRSRKILKNNQIKIITVVISSLLLWFLCLIIPALLISYLFNTQSFFVIGVWDVILAFGFSWKTIFCLIAVGWINLIEIMLMPVMLTNIAVIYFNLDGLITLDEDDLLFINAKIKKGYNGIHKIGLLFRRILLLLVDILKRNSVIVKYKKIFTAIFSIVVLILIGIITRGTVIQLNATITEKSPVVIGHRGSAYGVENTLEAIQAAIDAGADYAEIDILLSKDGIPMVIHDSNLNRLSGERLKVYELTANELSNITLKQSGYVGNIPTLEEVLNYCKDNIKLNIEFKTHGYEVKDIIERVMMIIRASEFQDECIFQSSNYSLVEKMKEKYPEYEMGYIIYTNIGKLNKLNILNLKADFIVAEKSLVTKKVIKACKRAGKPIFVWTINTKQDMDEFWKIGIDGIITDEPELAKQSLIESGK